VIPTSRSTRALPHLLYQVGNSALALCGGITEIMPVYLDLILPPGPPMQGKLPGGRVKK
jgi:hypothetical protein